VVTVNLRVRLAHAADIPAMMALERTSSDVAHWSQRQYQDLFVIPSGQPSEHLAWVAVAEDEGEDKATHPEAIAFLIAHRVDAEWELENIVVAETARRQGVGTRLLRKLVEHACAARGKQIFLEVRESNRSARALYRNVGFEETGLRKGYYANPPEDAILCRLMLC
jgi:ribosomal-protein-alanine N-acetyltransferase